MLPPAGPRDVTLTRQRAQRRERDRRQRRRLRKLAKVREHARVGVEHEEPPLEPRVARAALLEPAQRRRGGTAAAVLERRAPVGARRVVARAQVVVAARGVQLQLARRAGGHQPRAPQVERRDRRELREVGEDEQGVAGEEKPAAALLAAVEVRVAAHVDDGIGRHGRPSHGSPAQEEPDTQIVRRLKVSLLAKGSTQSFKAARRPRNFDGVGRRGALNDAVRDDAAVAAEAAQRRRRPGRHLRRRRSSTLRCAAAAARRSP